MAENESQNPSNESSEHGTKLTWLQRLEQHLTDEFHSGLYKVLSETLWIEVEKGQWNDPINFFEYLQRELNFVLTNSDKPLSVKSHFQDLNPSDNPFNSGGSSKNVAADNLPIYRQRIFLLNALYLLLKNDAANNYKLKSVHSVIKEELHQSILTVFVFQEWIFETDIFGTLRTQLEYQIETQDKITLLVNVMAISLKEFGFPIQEVNDWNKQRKFFRQFSNSERFQKAFADWETQRFFQCFHQEIERLLALSYLEQLSHAPLATRLKKQNSSLELEKYLSDSFNLRVYESLETLSYFEPVEFFQLLDELYGLVKAGKSLSAIGKINNLSLTKPLSLFTIYFLRERILQDGNGQLSENSLNENSFVGISLLEKETEKLGGNSTFNALLINSHSADERALALIETDRAVSKAISMLVESKINKAKEKIQNEEMIELRARQAERERLENLFAVNLPQEKNSADENQDDEHSMARRVLAIDYLLRKAGLNKGQINKTDIARFVAFLMGKSVDKIQNTNLYKKVREPNLEFANDGEDIIYVRNQFEKLGLTDIVAEINEEIRRQQKKRQKF